MSSEFGPVRIGSVFLKGNKRPDGYVHEQHVLENGVITVVGFEHDYTLYEPKADGMVGPVIGHRYIRLGNAHV